MSGKEQAGMVKHGNCIADGLNLACSLNITFCIVCKINAGGHIGPEFHSIIHDHAAFKIKYCLVSHRDGRRLRGIQDSFVLF